MADQIADRVVEVIQSSGLNRGEFAALIGLDPPKLSKSLGGVRRFTSLELALIAERGGVTVDWLLTGAGRSSPVLAARAAAVEDDAVERAAARAEHLEELWAGLAEMGAIEPPPALPAVPLRGPLIQQGADLAERAWSVVRQRAPDGDAVDDLPGVLEAVFGVDVEVREMGDGLDGISYRRDDFRLALVSARSAWTRQRFTMAHELGHLLAGDGEGLRVDRDVMAPSTRREHAEMRANAFAATFLMPAGTLRSCAAAEVDEHLFARLLGELAVSPSALAWRLSSLGLIDEATRRGLAGTSLRSAALRGGWFDRFRAREERGATRPCMRLLDAAVRAYERREISVRPIAELLDRPVDTVLVALAPTEPESGTDVEEPVFTP